MPQLFSPLRLRGVTLRNRIVMSPMCMYSAAEDGLATDFHLAHLGARATGGVGLIITEAAAVEARGRISVNDLGLWSDAQVEPLARVVRFCKSQGAMTCTQLAHAGRKAWSPTKGVGPLPPVAPSAIPFDADWVTPRELTLAELDGIVSAFRAATDRALRASFDAVEIGRAHV
jgi:2,4-dienoyl-CoA reductase-like NADH-dependent reductase (Old Yellow Enzyme family)